MKKKRTNKRVKNAMNCHSKNNNNINNTKKEIMNPIKAKMLAQVEASVEKQYKDQPETIKDSVKELKYAQEVELIIVKIHDVKADILHHKIETEVLSISDTKAVMAKTEAIAKLNQELDILESQLTALK